MTCSLYYIGFSQSILISFLAYKCKKKPANIERAMFQLTAAVILNFYNSTMTISQYDHEESNKSVRYRYWTLTVCTYMIQGFRIYFE